jgi:hypothetical protein
VPTKSNEYDANSAVVPHSQCASTQPGLTQSNTQLKSSIAHSCSWSPSALNTSSEHPLVQDELKLYDIEPKLPNEYERDAPYDELKL